MNQKRLALQITALNILFSSWEWLFLFFISFHFASKPNGGIITGIFLMTNSVVRLLFSRRLAHLADKLNEPDQLKSSLSTRSTVLILMLTMPFISQETFALVIWFIVVNTLLVFDAYASFNLKYRFVDSGSLEIVQQSSLHNLGKRGALVVTSYVAFALNGNWREFSLICLALAVASVVSAIMAIAFFNKDKLRQQARTAVSSEMRKTADNSFVAPNTQVYFAASLVFLMNLLFGSNSMLLVRAVEQYRLTLGSNITILTVFYVGFVVVNALATRFYKTVDSHSSQRELSMLYLATAALGIAIALSHSTPILWATSALLQGSVYALTLLCFNAYLFRSIRGLNQNALNAMVDSWGRTGFILAQVASGFLLDKAQDPIYLLASFSFSSIPALVLMFFALKRGVRYAT